MEITKASEAKKAQASTTTYRYQNDFESYTRLREQYGHNAHLLYALQLRFDIDDINTEASESLTDGSDGKNAILSTRIPTMESL